VNIVRSCKDGLSAAACGILAVTSSLILLPSASAAQYKISEIKNWHDVISDKDLSTKRTLVGSFALENGNKCSLIVVPPRLRVGPALASVASGKGKTAPTSKVVLDEKALFGVNGGYFNLSNGESTSYVVLKGTVCADPTKNLALTENPKLKPFLTQIYNRS
jgi:exopolysaccharide biosynthesis protein